MLTLKTGNLKEASMDRESNNNILSLSTVVNQRNLKEASMEKEHEEDFLSISTVLNELEKDLSSQTIELKKEKAPSGKEAILKILSRAADDHKFLARMAEDPAKVLKEYDLTAEEKAALISADLRRIESWVGKLDKRLGTWIWCRLQQEKW
jgi:hypothetical protein